MASSADLDAIGQVCARPDCHYRDFLPFYCTYCQAWYCDQHRQVEWHLSCPGRPDRRVEKCTQCRRVHASTTPCDQLPPKHTHTTTGPVPPSVSITSSMHTAHGGKPARCEAAQCQQRITAVRPGVQCSQCRATFCLNHRFPDQHQCNPQIRRRELLARAAEARQVACMAVRTPAA